MDTVDEVKRRLNIEDVIGEYIQLKRAGRNFKGLSPFNNEKTPSFMVSPEKQIWHDFSSGKGGNIFTFVMEMEGLDFKDALEHLAKKAGIDLSQVKGMGRTNQKIKARVLEALSLAAVFYQKQFIISKTALDYVSKKRKLTKQTVMDFVIGYSPNRPTALGDYLRKKGFNNQELQRAGLVTKSGKNTDMFRGRLMIPLMDSHGQIIGFTARLLDEQSQSNMPKYINTPQSLVYDKSRHVFGLHLAKEDIRKEKFAVVVEGNMDVIASYQAGVKNVVATAGTALTEDHLKAISRFTTDIRLSFDSDQAGLNATERTVPIASKLGLSLSIIKLKGSKDPDEMIQKDPKLWVKAVSRPQYALDWLLEYQAMQNDLSTGQGKRTFSDALLPVLSNLADAVEKDHYITKSAEYLKVSPAALREKLDQTKNSQKLKTKAVSQVEISKQQLEWAKAQDHFLSLVLMRPELRDLLEILDHEMLPQESAQRLLDYLQSHPDFKGDLKKAPLLQTISDYVKILSLQYEALFASLDEVEGRYEAARLRARLIEIFVKIKKTQVATGINEADEETARKLLLRVKSLDNLLKVSKEISQ